VSVWIVEGVSDDRLKAERYFCRVDLEIRKWREICVLLNPEQVARIINCLILAGGKEGVGMESYTAVRPLPSSVFGRHDTLE
jgi:hypothetical protein